MTEEASIMILGSKIPVVNQQIPIEKLKYLVSNPRVHSTLSSGSTKSPADKEELQELVHDQMINEASVKKLIPNIKHQGGLLEPIFVRHDTMEVIEGNSRLRAYHYLNSLDKEKSGQWSEIPCQVVSSLTDEQQLAYLHQIHVEGKTPWLAYEKANFVYTMWNEGEVAKTKIAKTLSIGLPEVEKRIRVIETMIKNRDQVRSNFSYYEVLVRSKSISSEIEKNPLLKKNLLKSIKEMEKSSDDETKFTAQNLRDKLPTIIDRKKELKKFVEGKSSFEDAYQNARISGPAQSIKVAIDKISDITMQDLSEQSKVELNTLEIAIRRMSKSTKRLRDMLEEAKKMID